MAATLLVGMACGRINPAAAQLIQPAVGGVLIDADGVLVNAEVDKMNLLRDLRAKALKEIPADLNQPSKLRKISLRSLAAALAEQQQTGGPLPDDIKYLAGMQRVRYVFVYPERNDIVLAGYGEGWKVGPTGEVVGATTGQPVLLLDDLVVALRTAHDAAHGGLSCSIDPTAEGMRRLQMALKGQTAIGSPESTARGMEQALGPQTITVTGVPATSHFARVMVAADYRMKRLSMHMDPAPIQGLPSYLEMVRGGSRAIQTPRLWLAANYDAMLTDGEGLAWELRGPGVKAMTEEDTFAVTGERKHTGKANPLAKKWADNMTAKYNELSRHDSIFGQLRNCMDLAVVAALIAKEDLANRAGCDLGLLASATGLSLDQFAAPKQVDSKSSIIQNGRGWTVSASGGVLIHSWGIADKKEKSDSLAPLRDKALAASGKRWWWD
jgi:Protein of unknown function (DUF1598)